ncbi:hypothetical protein FXR42_24045 [Salmonella enterica]|nr:hypothetical protein [Salmonella enterica]EBA1043402.1 hypothetical protein [Salmonella enterica]ECO4457342.1 hypothetical protein [Salmonella enterica]ECO8804456.1 hypothetical protein [Salmonella enterica]
MLQSATAMNWLRRAFSVSFPALGTQRTLLTELKIRCERGIVIRTLRITLLSDSGYALTGYEY